MLRTAYGLPARFSSAWAGACLILGLCLGAPAALAQQPPIVIGQTPVDPVTGERILSSLVPFLATYPDTVQEARQLKYTTPSNFAGRGAASVNLWLIFHGGGGNTDTMNRYFDVIPDSAPTVIVFPEGLPGTQGSTRWRGVTLPGEASLAESYRDVFFVEQLVSNLLAANPQLHPGKVYASGFSSGGNMTWMLLCYRSKMFAGFGMFSKQLTSFKRDGGCGDGRIQDPVTGAYTIQTGYEVLTLGRRPDRYGYNPSLPVNKQVNKVKAVFYSHGTLDDNLVYPGAPGCSTLVPPTCGPTDDPDNSMDPGGPNQNRDDISTKNWLLSRHDLLDTNPAGTVLPDEDPVNRNDSVVTTLRTYKTSLGTPGVTSRKRVRWLEMDGGIHAVSALDHEGDVCTNLTPPPNQTDCNLNPNASKDYETSLQVKTFLEAYAGMLH